MVSRSKPAFAAWVALSGASFGAVDVPTWHIGDWWTVQKTYTIRTEQADFDLTFNMTENYTMSLTQIVEEPTLGNGIRKIYRRLRSGGTVQGHGTATLRGRSYKVRMPSSGSTNTGEIWRLVSDLSNVRLQFQLTGNVEAEIQIPPFPPSYRKIATALINFDERSWTPGEEGDFPLHPIGETWTAPTVGRLTGLVRIAWDKNFPWWLIGGRPADIVYPLDRDIAESLNFVYMGPDPLAAFPDAHRIESPGLQQLWHSPSAKEFVEMRVSQIEVGENTRFENEVRRITGCGLGPDANITQLQFDPPRPYPGQRTILRGLTAPNTTVTATLLDDWDTTQTISDGGGNFAAPVTAPNHNDQSPGSADGGSFGVEVLVNGVGNTVTTMQIWRRSAVSPSWTRYAE